MPSRNSKKKSVIPTLVRIIVVFVLAGLFLWKIDIKSFLTHFNVKMLVGILAAQPFMLISNSILGFRHSMLVKIPAAPFIPSFKAVTLAIGLNVVLPLHMSQFFKATYLKKHAGIPFSAGLAAILMERVADLAVLAVLLPTCFILLFIEKTQIFYIIPLFIFALFIVVMLSHGGNILLRIAGHIRYKAIREFLENAVKHASLMVKKGLFYQAIVLGAGAMALSFSGLFLVVYLSGSIPVGFVGMLNLYVLTTFIGSAVPSLPGGFGAYEAAAVFVLKGMGYAVEEALALALALHCSQIVLFFVLALLIMAIDETGFYQLVKEAEKYRKSKQ